MEPYSLCSSSEQSLASDEYVLGDLCLFLSCGRAGSNYSACSEVDVTQQQSSLFLPGQMDRLTCRVLEASPHVSLLVSMYSLPACLGPCSPLW